MAALTLDEIDAACARLDGSDGARALALARAATGSEAEARELLAEVEAKVAAVAEGIAFRRAVATVAEHLLLRRELDGAAVADLINLEA
jgi:hypothetical protein